MTTRTKHPVRPLDCGLLILLLGMVGCRSGEQLPPGVPVTPDALLSEYFDSTAVDHPTLKRAFVDAAKRDYVALHRQKRGWAFQGASFDELVFLVFTGAIKLDNTEDDVHGLTQLRHYVDRRRPALSEMLYARMQDFYYSSKENQTPARGEFFEHVTYLIHGPDM